MTKSFHFPSLKHSILLLSALFLTGCGYKLGNIGHPQLKSVAIAPVVKDTLAYNAAAAVRGLLAESFQTDGTMTLTGMDKADCIVYARITSITFSAISWSTNDNDDSYLPNEWQIKMTVEYSVVLPGKATPLLKNKTATGVAEFMSGPDVEISRNYAIRQAAFATSKQIVSQITEAW